MIEIAHSTPFREYLTGKNLIKTPNDIFSLPIGTILEPGKFGGLRAYDCNLYLGKVDIFLDETKKTPVKDELVIVYRGIPTAIKYHPRFGMHKVSHDPGIDVTVLGFSKRSAIYRKYIGNWAFIDFVSK